MVAEKWYDPVYFVNYALLICPPSKIDGWVKANLGTSVELGDLSATNALCITHSSGKNGQVQVFWFPPAPYVDSLPKANALIAHEALHAVFSVMRAKDVCPTAGAEEAWTYYLGWVVNQLTSRLASKGKWKKLLLPSTSRKK
jgi:hypothetical protein